LDEERQPKDAERDEEELDERAVGLVAREGPTVEDDVGKQEEVEGEGDAVKWARREASQGAGVSSHVSDAPLVAEVTCNWQFCSVRRATKPSTGRDVVAHTNRLTLGEDVVMVQTPGPTRGMTATGEAGLTSPSTSPLATFALGPLSLGLTVKFVVTADNRFGTDVVASRATGSVGNLGFKVGVTVERACVMVVVVDSSVVVVTTRASFAERCATCVDGWLGSVITITSRRSGLEYISRCAPRGRRLGMVMVLEG